MRQIVTFFTFVLVVVGCTKKPHVLTADEKAVVEKFDERIGMLDRVSRVIHEAAQSKSELLATALTNNINNLDVIDLNKQVIKDGDEVDRILREKFETEIRKLEYIVDCSRH
jgi:hypothetical protein